MKQSGTAQNIPLDVDAAVRAGVGTTLVSSLGQAHGVEDLHHRDAQTLARLDRDPAGHPEVAVDQVIPSPRAPDEIEQVITKFRHQRPEIVLEQVRTRTSVEMDDADIGG